MLVSVSRGEIYAEKSYVYEKGDVADSDLFLHAKAAAITAAALICMLLVLNFFNDDSVTVSGNTEDIGLISCSTSNICSLGIKCDVVKIYANNSITAQIIGCFF